MFDVTDWTRNNCNTYIVQCAKKNHTQKVLKNHTQNVVEKLVKNPFMKILISLDQQTGML